MTDHNTNPTQRSEALEDAKQTGQSLKDEAVHRASEMRDRVTEEAQSRAEGAKDHVADEVSSVGKALRDASGELRGGSPQEQVFSYMADGLADFADSVRGKSVGDFVADLGDFGRRNPVAFLGGAALLGFAGARLAKASSRDSRVGPAVGTAPPPPAPAPQSPTARAGTGVGTAGGTGSVSTTGARTTAAPEDPKVHPQVSEGL
ncbi:hypothetical protein [Pseudoroseicyclus tamaricis]|uniref:ElaB/YqjD/DUF883 family membrane-anchored ribosome-binding protein n=1 Tax=Pseudoroseicyclus tamaricis TaxID=2705421 RepID=A0A6B2JWW6_9RHOB|nr:hypothetical protein [Pseudoroseicyclus tamaricis]NDV02405.1 hypothetical protein [Pseudoroseicyclus tamaricis]